MLVTCVFIPFPVGEGSILFMDHKGSIILAETSQWGYIGHQPEKVPAQSMLGKERSNCEQV